jgi:hypothetical protein
MRQVSEMAHLTFTPLYLPDLRCLGSGDCSSRSDGDFGSAWLAHLEPASPTFENVPVRT